MSSQTKDWKPYNFPIHGALVCVFVSKVGTRLLIQCIFFIFININIVYSHWIFMWINTCGIMSLIKKCKTTKKYVLYCSRTPSEHCPDTLEQGTEPTLCFFDTAANPWCSLNELHEVLRQGYLVEFLALLMGLGPSVVLCRCQAATQLTAQLDNF